MDEPICKNCKRFIQHYTFIGSKLAEVNCGHCAVKRSIKRKKADSKACEYFEQGTDPTEAFVTKEYLTKALLNKVLSEELMPEVWKLV